MQMYEKAYQRYIEKCEQFGIAKIDIIQFIKNVSDEQVQMMIQELQTYEGIGGTR